MTGITAHYSSLSLHRQCPTAWYYKYDLKLGKTDDIHSAPRDFGQWWSALRAVEAAERGIAHKTFREPVGGTISPVDGHTFSLRYDDCATVDDVLDAAASDWERWPEERTEDFIATMGDNLPDRLSSAYQLWLTEFAEERENEHPIAVEQFWKRALPRPKADGEWGDGIENMPELQLMGYVDEIYLDTRRNEVVVRDSKTSKNIQRNGALDDMMDSQLQLYAWGLAPTLKRWGVDQVRAVAYDRIRSTASKQPQITKSGTLSKSVTDYDAATYVAWAAGEDGNGVPFPGLKKDGSGAGVYTVEESVVEKLNRPDWRATFATRTQRPVNVNLVRAHLRAAIDTATDIWRTQRRIESAGEVARNLGQACKWCDFSDLCRAQMFGGKQGEYELAEFGLRAKSGENYLDAGKLVQRETVFAAPGEAHPDL